MSPGSVCACALVLLAGAAVVQACLDKNTVVEAKGDMKVSMIEQAFRGDDYQTVQELSFTQAVPWDRTTMTVYPEVRTISEKPGKKQFACFSRVAWAQPCRMTMNEASPPRLWQGGCIPANNGSTWGGMSDGAVTGLAERPPGANTKCEPATATNYKWQMNKTSPNTVAFTYIETKEVDECDKSPTKRYIRKERVDYRVADGCLLSAKPEGGKPAACKAGYVEMKVNGDYRMCVKRDNVCSLTESGFMRCPEGMAVTKMGQLEVAGGTKQPAAVCSLCKPHTFKGYTDFISTSLLTDKCQPCPDWTQSEAYGSVGCNGCRAGTYPKNKRAPLQCTDCPPGTYSQGYSKKCTKCAADFFQDEAGKSECKRCPTAWKCLVPASALGKFSETPFRWDESGNPACLSKNGKECWKGEGSCAQKLRQAKTMMEAGKVKSLVCGDMHKKVWGTTGYEDYNSWCNLSKRVFMRPGKEGGGAAECSGKTTSADIAAAQADATADPEEFKMCLDKGCTCPA